MASPRERLRAAVGACLQRISVANGYQTDAGASFTLEPGQVDEDAAAVITVLVAKQQRASESALVRTHRLTTVVIVAKVPAPLDTAQAQLDALVSDIELAMADQQFRYPPGMQCPQYVSMEPVKPEAGMSWVGALLTYQSHIPIT
ncbi:hypothetical protein CFBP498_26650 [Xanthomonas hortorum pv. vitians]|uniref:Tail terminator n=2 Tax=Xanthomonas hortorum TaxID=56454 RepID=A0A6V7DRZ0_9XANT|nr:MULTISPECIES: hypothetical protein [Xanthomonas]MCE4303960.1 hypothetical protein [Xanthomonas hortorum pv. vitians]MDT7825636.1 hypothetical protein [Xanthomonas hortorum pv. vitians]MDV7249916.1 hypothetical protein [Xanthomonas hortorum pv. vitians]MEA9738677.1 hypothetical protein [Xanthomonas campestris pv. raphani]NMI31945.1 hypothetical protein [Xanthomonas hortorum pv. vitians]